MNKLQLDISAIDPLQQSTQGSTTTLVQPSRETNKSQILPTGTALATYKVPSLKTKEILNLSDANVDFYQQYDSPIKSFDTRGTRSISLFRKQSTDSLERTLGLTSQLKDKLKLITDNNDSGATQVVSNHSTLHKRRVIEDGVKMLDEHFIVKKTQEQVTLMENRIKRLMFEEERSRKLAEVAKLKADQMLQARARHQQDLREKFRYYGDQQAWLNAQKDRNQRQKIINKVLIQQSKTEILAKKYQAKEEVRQQEKIHEEIVNKAKLDEVCIKKQNKIKMLIERNKALKQKVEEQSSYNKQLKANYGQKFIVKVVKEEEESAKIKQLERLEQQLLEKLKHTHVLQKNQIRNVEQIVSEGYQYYQNSFSELRAHKYSSYTNSKAKFVSRNSSLPTSHSMGPATPSLNNSLF